MIKLFMRIEEWLEEHIVKIAISSVILCWSPFIVLLFILLLKMLFNAKIIIINF